MNHDECTGLARALFEESHEAQFLLDPETGQVLDANAAAQRLCSLSLRDILNIPVGDLFQMYGKASVIGFPLSDWRVDRPYSEWGCTLHALQGIRTPVDVTVVRLIVSPRPLALLRAREAGTADPKPDATTGRSRFQHLLATAPGCLWSAEITGRGEGRFNYLSPSVQLVAGRPADFIGVQLKRWRDLIHTQDQNAWDASLERRRSGCVTQDEYRVVWPDGSVRWVQDHARSIRALIGPVWLYGVFTDVTHRKLTDEPLRRLAELVSTAEDAIFTQTVDGMITDWNRGAERLYGYSKEEIQSQSALRLFTPDSVDYHATAVRRLWRGDVCEPYETVQVRKDGQRFVVSMRLSPIRNGAGEPDRISIIARYIPGRDSLPAESGFGSDLQSAGS